MGEIRSKRLAVLAALAVCAALVVAAVATAAKPTSVTVGNLKLTVNGDFSPKTLPKGQLAPIGFDLEGKIDTLDGTQPPALREFIVEADKNTAITVKGFPAVCLPGQLQSQDTKHAKAICGKAIIGEGKTTVDVLLAESRLVRVKSDLLLFNGGIKGGKTTLLVHAYITVPVPAAIVTTVKITKVHNGRYGMRSVASVPKIAGGAGSVRSFSLHVDKEYTYRGKRISVLTAKCPDGRLQASGEAIFADGTKAAAEVARPCTGK